MMDSLPSSPNYPSATFIISLVLITIPVQILSASQIITHSNFLQYYTPHCSSFLPPKTAMQTPYNFQNGQFAIFSKNFAYLAGGKQIAGKIISGDPLATSFSLRPERDSLYVTESPNLITFEAMLKIQVPFKGNNATWRRNLRRFRIVPPKIPVKSESLRFVLYGFWSISDGKICMVGNGVNLELGVVFKVNYSIGLLNVSSLISGKLESLSEKGSLGYFDPVSMLALPRLGEYKYSFVEKGGTDICKSEERIGDENDNLSVKFVDELSMCLTHLYEYARTFDLEYESDCVDGNGGKCNPLGTENVVLPSFMTIQGIRCDEGGLIRVLIGFSNSGFYGAGFVYESVFDPNVMFIGEGLWNQKKNRFCVVACRVLNFKDSLENASVGDCSIRLSLRFRRTLTILHTTPVVGKIWSNKTEDDPGYFKRIGFHGSRNKITGLRGLKYEYTMLDKVSKICATSKNVKAEGKTYPYGHSSDMRFFMSMRNSQGQIARGFLSPRFVGDQLYEPHQVNNNRIGGPLNVSYSLRLTPVSVFNLDEKLFSNETVEISAEGTFDHSAGVLCMIGCRHRVSHTKKATNNDRLDCEISINLQFSPTDGKVRDKGNVKGTIRSMRAKSDPLFFGQLEISSKSMYFNQAKESIWRMDVEVILVLISKTLACVFVGLQLYHANKNPDVLPFISISMLVILVLGHMIPLLLNFEALFVQNRSRQNVFLETGGWCEVNEVIVRLVTMVAFLLHFRLLQLAWSSRRNDESNKSIWLSEKKVAFLCSPLYIGGVLIAWYVHQWQGSYSSRPYFQSRYMRNRQQHSPLRDLKSYAGFILDGFLFPQIIFNLFLNSRESALSSAFYIGITTIRSLPHAYDLYRTHSSSWYLDSSYIYANHQQDFYSTAWDIIIPAIGLLFACVVYLQQRFGGRCIFPERFRHNEYEKVPVVNGEEPQDATRK